MTEAKHTHHTATDPGPAPQPTPSSTRANQLPQVVSGDPGYGLGIAAFIISFFVGVAGIVMGAVALKQSKQVGKRNSLAFAGFVIGIVKTALDVLAIIGMIVGLVFAVGYCNAHQDSCMSHEQYYQNNQDYRNLPDGQTY